MQKDTTPRWQYRFENFSRAHVLLKGSLAEAKQRTLSDLEEEGLIQRFEYTWELAWKCLKDFLESEGVTLEPVTPSAVIKAAFAAKVIKDGTAWLKALDDRNLMSHTYSNKVFEEVIGRIAALHAALFDELNSFFVGRLHA